MNADATAIAEPATGRFWGAMAVVCAVMGSAAAFELSIGNWVVAIPFGAAVVGVVRRVVWGRRTAFFLGWVLLVGGFALMFPVEKGLEVPGQDPIPLEIVVAEALVVCSMALVCLHLLGVHKKAFRAAWF